MIVLSRLKGNEYPCCRRRSDGPGHGSRACALWSSVRLIEKNSSSIAGLRLDSTRSHAEGVRSDGVVDDFLTAGPLDWRLELLQRTSKDRSVASGYPGVSLSIHTESFANETSAFLKPCHASGCSSREGNRDHCAFKGTTMRFVRLRSGAGRVLEDRVD